MYYVEKRNNGEKFTATDEYGLTWNYTYQDGKATNVYYESGDIESLNGIINIPARLEGYPVVDLNNIYGGNIFVKLPEDENTIVKQIKVPNSVTNIGYSAFYKCTGLTEIEISNVESIENYAFSGCSGLTEINMQNVTRIEDNAFYECSSLENIELPENLTVIEESMLNSCNSLKSIIIKNNVKEVKNGAFANCISLSKILIWNNVEELGYRTFDKWTSDQTVKFEVKEIQEGWDKNWNYNCNAEIIFGYTGE